MEEEVWKDIPGYEGLYEISNFSNVKSIARVVVRNTYGIQPVGERILKQCLDSRGYYYVVLCKEKKHKNFSIHQLMAMAFLNHKPCGYQLVINHINGDKLKNTIDNIEIVTQRENSSICYRKNNHLFTSKYIGVSKQSGGGGWISTIYINGKTRYIGTFLSEELASIAYQSALSVLRKNVV